MEAFSLFCTVFINALIVFGLLICIYLYFFSGLRVVRKLKPSCYISYNKNHFDKDFEFYCNNKLRGRSTDKCGCSNCGASYQENLEILVHEEEDKLEKCHYEEYMQLRDLEADQNIMNEQRDARVDERYRTPIKLAEEKGKYIALFIIFVLMMISAVITFWIMKYR